MKSKLHSADFNETKEAARRMLCSRSKLHEDNAATRRGTNTSPNPRPLPVGYIGNKLVWRASDIDAWLERELTRPRTRRPGANLGRYSLPSKSTSAA